jgi:hypothetical protein
MCPRLVSLAQRSSTWPVLLDLTSGTGADLLHGPAPRRKEDQAAAAVVRIGLTFDVPGALQLLDRLLHGLAPDQG